MLNRIEHLGIAIKSLEASDHLFAKLLGKTPYKNLIIKGNAADSPAKVPKVIT